MKKQFGHYEIVSELGRGGMGVVYKAHEQSLNRYVALKVLGRQVADDASLIARFKREAQSAARLNHPNITQIYFFGQEEGQYYFVMEYVDGETLNDRIRREKRVAPKVAAQILFQAAGGLAVAHDAGIVHRDIKPGNIMIDRRGVVKIADFGIAHVQDTEQKLTATGQFLGTPGYLSPEVCLGKPMDHRSDIFSLGIVYFEMLTGSVPFRSDSPLAMLREVVESPIPDVRSLNADVDVDTHLILNKMIEKNPDERYQSCHELAEALNAYLTGNPISSLVGLAVDDAEPEDNLAPTRVMEAHTTSEAPTELITSPTPAAPPLASDRDSAPTVSDGTPPPIPQAAGPSSEPTSAPAPPPPPQPAPAGSAPPPPVGNTPPAFHASPPRVQRPPKTMRLAPVLGILALVALIMLVGAWFLMRPDGSTVDETAGDTRIDEYQGKARADGKGAEEHTDTRDSLSAGDGHAADTGETHSTDRTSTVAGSDNDGQTRVAGQEDGRTAYHAGDDRAVTNQTDAVGESTAGVENNRDKIGKTGDRSAADHAGKRASDKGFTAERESYSETVDSDALRSDGGPATTAVENAVVPKSPKMYVWVTGHPMMTKPLNRHLSKLLEDEGLTVMDTDLDTPPERYRGSRPDLAGLGDFVVAAGGDVLLLVKAEELGERVVDGGGRRASVYKVGITYQCYFPKGRRKLGKDTYDEFEYSQIKANEKAELSANKVIDTLLEQIRR